MDPVLKEASRAGAAAPARPPQLSGATRPGAGCLCLACPVTPTQRYQRAPPHDPCRVRPTWVQAPKRGLDVEQLQDSRTPAWRNLRGRSASQRKQSYYEGPEQEDEDDELEDQPSSGSEGAEEEEEEGGDGSSDEVRERGRDGAAGQRRRLGALHTAAAVHPATGGLQQLAWCGFAPCLN